MADVSSTSFRAAADGAVERRVDVVLVRQKSGAPVDLGIALDIAVRCGRIDEGRTAPGGEQLLRAKALAGDLQDAVIEPFFQPRDLRDHLGLVVDELGAEPIEAVGERAVGLVVDGAVILEQAPVEIARQYRAALADALGLDGVKLLLQLLPGVGRLVEAGFLEMLLVEPEDRRRGVERHRRHATLVAPEACHRLDEIRPVDLGALLLHEVLHRHDRAGEQHRHVAALGDLHHFGRPPGAIGRDHAIGHLVVIALGDRDDGVFILGRVEFLDQLVEPVAQHTAHGVPPLHFDARRLGGRDRRQNPEQSRNECHLLHG